VEGIVDRNVRKDPRIRLALAIARENHAGQTDKSGADYILHPISVASFLPSKKGDEIVVALLHDVIEDTAVTAESLRAFGFDKTIVNAVVALTKRQGESYADYLVRVEAVPLALKVKIADAKHNADIKRFSLPTEADIAKSRVYESHYEAMLAILRKSEPGFALLSDAQSDARRIELLNLMLELQ